MVQEKYNSKIYNEAREETLQRYSHLRANCLSPAGLQEGEAVCIVAPDSVSLVEYALDLGCQVCVLDAGDDMLRLFDQEGLIKKGLLAASELIELKEKGLLFDAIIMVGQASRLYPELKPFLKSEGRMIRVFSTKQTRLDFEVRGLSATGFNNILAYVLKPDYLYTTEIYDINYFKGEAEDYLLIGR